MREILFRAKAINRKPGRGYRTNYKNGDWVYGLITKLHDEEFPILPAEMTNTDGISGIDVNYKTIGQYTGLKDMHGKKIFEGDILRFPYPSTQNIYSVMWSGGSFVRKDPDGYYLSLNALNCDEYEVIGNIYDNPELLEGENNG